MVAWGAEEAAGGGRQFADVHAARAVGVAGNTEVVGVLHRQPQVAGIDILVVVVGLSVPGTSVQDKRVDVVVAVSRYPDEASLHTDT